ncbi:hypothetical protein D3C71_1548880 [compost metagenome]
MITHAGLHADRGGSHAGRHGLVGDDGAEDLARLAQVDLSCLLDHGDGIRARHEQRHAVRVRSRDLVGDGRIVPIAQRRKVGPDDLDAGLLGFAAVPVPTVTGGLVVGRDAINALELLFLGVGQRHALLHAQRVGSAERVARAARHRDLVVGGHRDQVRDLALLGDVHDGQRTG